MNNTLEKIISLPKSLYINLRLLSFKDAIKIPFLVRYNTKIVSLKGKIKIKDDVRFNMLKLGFGEVGIYDNKYERSIIQIGGILEIEGNANFGQGGRICITKNGYLKIGENFVNTAMGTIVCDKEIIIGNNVATSWYSLIMDTDWHKTINTITQEVKEEKRPINIGNNVWIGTRATILKGSEIADGCIIGANAMVSGKFNLKNSCIAGNPAKIIKENITKYQ